MMNFQQIPVVIFATMRRSGSHFAMHRALSSVRISGPNAFGAHINSFSLRRLDLKKPFDVAKVLARRKLNYFYIDAQHNRPRWSGDPGAESMRDSLYAWLSVEGKSKPDERQLDFLAINIEDMPLDIVVDSVRRILSPNPYFATTVTSFPIFVTLRSLRSIALSRTHLLEKRTSDVMASGFRNLPVKVWEDHYLASTKGVTNAGHPVVPLHYKQGVETQGQSFVDAFTSNVELPCRSFVPEWVQGYVMPDATGSSFVGSGINKEQQVVRG